MALPSLRSWFQSQTRWEQVAWTVWGILLLVVSVRVALEPANKTVYPIFSASSYFWWTGEELYEPYRPIDVQSGYRYSPTCAILFTPFGIFPDELGGVLWRLFSVAAFLAALAWFARRVVPATLSRDQWGLMLLLVIPLSIQSINNGQANIVVIACMLGAVASVREKCWNLASAFIAVAFIFKLYPLALGMVLVALYPRQLGWRILAACAVSLAIPFLCQHPAYVIDQYAKWIALMRAEDRTDIHLEHMYRDLWLLIHLYGVPINRTVYTMLQIAAGAGVALLCWRRQRAGWSTPDVLTSALGLTTAWMMLLGPATESSSFALLAPSFAWSIVEALRSQHRTWRHTVLWGSCVIFMLAVVVGGIVTNWRLHQAGVHAWASLAYFAYLLAEPAAPEVRQSESQRMAA